MSKGIWKYFPDEIKNKISIQISANEGSTPLLQINGADYNLNTLSMKLENLNPFGSFKDRSLAYVLSYYYSKGNKEFAISSSGNAGISAAGYVDIINKTFGDKVVLKIFISDQIPSSKFQRLQKIVKENSFITVVKSSKPKSDCIKFCNDSNCLNLRQSADDKATIGYETIVYENFEELTAVDSIFICCSSGTSTVGISNALNNHNFNIPIHIVQTTKIHPIAKLFDIKFIKSETSLSSAISDRIAKRKDSVNAIVKSSNGFGWIINDEEIEDGINRVNSIPELKRYNFEEISPEMGLVFAGMQKALNSGFEINNPLLIFSGY